MATVRIEESVDVGAPIERVFDVLTDPLRTPEWNPSIVQIVDFSGYPVREGTRWRQTVMILGKPTELDCRIVAFRPPHEGVLDITGGQRGRVVTRCQERGSTTHVHQTVEVVMPGGILGAIASKAGEVAIRREVAATLHRQKAALEAPQGGTDGSGTS